MRGAGSSCVASSINLHHIIACHQLITMNNYFFIFFFVLSLSSIIILDDLYWSFPMMISVESIKLKWRDIEARPIKILLEDDYKITIIIKKKHK